MVIAPLLGPNLALSFATTLGDPRLSQKAGRAIALGGIFNHPHDDLDLVLATCKGNQKTMII